MDEAKLRDLIERLAEAERHVAQSREHITRQQELIAQLTATAAPWINPRPVPTRPSL
jgi:hypothetical protein